MEQAVTEAIGWGHGSSGPGSMTGIIGDHGSFLAEHHPIAVTTGSSLTVYATVRNLEHCCGVPGIDLARGGHGRGSRAASQRLWPHCWHPCRGALILKPGGLHSRAIHWANRLERGWTWISQGPWPKPRSW